MAVGTPGLVTLVETGLKLETGEVDPLGEFAAEAINTPLIQGATLVAVIGFMFVCS